MDEQKVTLSFVAIVAVVAIVGIVLLFMNYGSMTGEATKATKTQVVPSGGEGGTAIAGGNCSCSGDIH